LPFALPFEFWFDGVLVVVLDILKLGSF